MLEKLKYEEQILEAFGVLEKTPRGTQLQDINSIIYAYIDEGYDSVILNASTGAGKSIIGAVVAEVLEQHFPFLIDESQPAMHKGSFILMGTNILTDQYAATFNETQGFLLVKGASNYSCDLLSTVAEPKFGDDCCKADLSLKDPVMAEMINTFCQSCELSENRSNRLLCRHMITNYSFYFVDRLLADRFPPRTITVWDEAHTINDIFSEHCTIFLSEKRLDAINEEIHQVLELRDVEVGKKIASIKTGLNGEYNDGNYQEGIRDLLAVYQAAAVTAEERMKQINRKFHLKEFAKMKKIGKKYKELAGKIEDFFIHNYEHVFELDKDRKEFYIKPIFVGKMFERLINSRYQLFMSATVSKDLLVKTLNLDPKTTKFIKLKPSFPKEHKKVIFHAIDKLNYETMKNPNTITKLCNACNIITNNHIAEQESGIILTPSFDVTEQITKAINGVKVFEHRRGEKLAELVKEFKECKEPSVLISPSLWEGISLDGDYSRFQIIVKAPFASLGDRRTNYIANFHKDVYTLGTILKLVQGCGRSVRSEDESATTYMLDQMITWTWQNKLNVWRDEHQEIYKQFL
jgi:ATP-dependent DNA helicase DinG